MTMSVIERGHLSELQRILKESQWDIGSKALDSKGQTALHIACAYGHLHIVQYLVNERRCCVEVEDVYGQTPFMLSLLNKHWNVADFLLVVDQSSATNEHKSIPLYSFRENVGNEALVACCEGNYLELVKFLTNKCHINISESCVESAISNNHWAIALYLKFEKGDSLAALSSSHFIHLFRAAWKTKQWLAANSLLEHAQRRGSHEAIGLSSTGLVQLIEVVLFKTQAFTIACGKGYLEVVNYLHTMSLCSSTEPGGEALEFARSNSQWNIVHFLLKYCNYRTPDDMCELHAASIIGDEWKVKAALSNSESTLVSKLDQYGITPMHYASLYNEPKILRMIIDIIEKGNRVPFNALDKNGNTPLHYAVMGDCRESVWLLLTESVVNINLVNCKGETPLIIACKQNNTTIIKMFVSDERCDLNIQDENGDTPLHIAIKKNSNDLVVELLTLHKSCNPNISNQDGVTPLQVALKSEQLSVAEVLLRSRKCSNVDINCCGISCLLHRVIQEDRYLLFSMIVKTQECNINEADHDLLAPLHVACKTSKFNVEYIQQLIQQPTCDLDIQDCNGETALHIAACSEWNSAEKIECILHSGRCNPNITNKEGHCPLHIATINKRFDSAEWFLKCPKCDPNIQDINGNTALHLGIDKMSVIDIECFLRCENVYPNIKNRWGNTPLHIAVIRRIPVHVVEALTHHANCNVSIANNEGETPLQLSLNMNSLFIATIIVKKCSHEDVKKVAIKDTSAVLYNAVLENYVTLVQALLKFQIAKVNMVYNSLESGETLLHAACGKGHSYMAEILLENGAGVQTVESSGDSPIHIVCKHLRLNCLKVLLHSKRCDPNQQNADGDTALHIVCRVEQKISSMRFVEVLISTPGIDPEIANHAGLTPVEVAGTKYTVIETINNYLKQKKSSIQTYLKIFVVGNSGTGKSTLIKAVTTEAPPSLKYTLFPKMKHVDPRDVPPHTAGIVPIPFNSKHFGHAVLYDFAGQHEYYSSHAAVMENLILPSPPLFLLLIDISKPLEEIKEELVYWWQFINNNSQRAAAPPHVIFVASHKDKVRARGEDPQTIIKILKGSVTDIQVSFMFEGSFPLDCRKLVSQGLTALLTKLNKTCRVLRQTADVDLHCHILKAFLSSSDFKNLVSCELSLIKEKVKTEHALLPSDPNQLIPLLSTLSDKGHILLLQNKTDVIKSYVVLKPEVLLKEVSGSIFAPKYFEEHCHGFAMSTGVVTLAKISEKFSRLNPAVITGYLTHMEYCFQIKDQHTLKMITEDPNIPLHSSEEFYFFPGLVRIENPTNVYLSLKTTPFECGWLYKCSKETEQLTTRFLHVLILRLAFSCEPPDDPAERESVVLLRSCSVWKHGIAWWTDDGIETIVEVGLQCRWVAVMMRCPDTHKVLCAELRSKVLRSVLRAKQDFCPAITMNEFLIAPSSLRYPFEGRELTLYSMRKITKIIIEGKDFAKDIEEKEPPLSISMLVPFEPYYKLGDLINHFFTAKQSLNTEISQEYLEQIAMACYKSLTHFQRALHPNLIAFEEECTRVGDSEVKKCVALFHTMKNSKKRPMRTWKDFEREFSKFSIFCGRNPMDIADRRQSDSIDPCETQKRYPLASDSDNVLGDSERNRQQDSNFETPIKDTAEGKSVDHSEEKNEGQCVSEPVQESYHEEDSQHEKQAMPSSIKAAITLIKGEKPSLKDLTNVVVPEFSSQWPVLGLQLNITRARLNQIQTDYPRDCRRCCTEMLSEWLSQDAGASWPTLIEALGSRAVDKTELAGCLQQCYMSASP